MDKERKNGHLIFPLGPSNLLSWYLSPNAIPESISQGTILEVEEFKFYNYEEKLEVTKLLVPTPPIYGKAPILWKPIRFPERLLPWPITIWKV